MIYHWSSIIGEQFGEKPNENFGEKSDEHFHENFNENFQMQKLESNDVRLRWNLDIFEALDELYPMGGVPGVFGSNSVRLRSYRYEKNPWEELYRMGVFSRPLEKIRFPRQ